MIKSNISFEGDYLKRCHSRKTSKKIKTSINIVEEAIKKGEQKAIEEEIK